MTRTRFLTAFTAAALLLMMAAPLMTGAAEAADGVEREAGSDWASLSSEALEVKGDGTGTLSYGLPGSSEIILKIRYNGIYLSEGEFTGDEEFISIDGHQWRVEGSGSTGDGALMFRMMNQLQLQKGEGTSVREASVGLTLEVSMSERDREFGSGGEKFMVKGLSEAKVDVIIEASEELDGYRLHLEQRMEGELPGEVHTRVQAREGEAAGDGGGAGEMVELYGQELQEGQGEAGYGGEGEAQENCTAGENGTSVEAGPEYGDEGDCPQNGSAGDDGAAEEIGPEYGDEGESPENGSAGEDGAAVQDGDGEEGDTQAGTGSGEPVGGEPGTQEQWRKRVEGADAGGAGGSGGEEGAGGDAGHQDGGGPAGGQWGETHRHQYDYGESSEGKMEHALKDGTSLGYYRWTRMVEYRYADGSESQGEAGAAHSGDGESVMLSYQLEGGASIVHDPAVGVEAEAIKAAIAEFAGEVVDFLREHVVSIAVGVVIGLVVVLALTGAAGRRRKGAESLDPAKNPYFKEPPVREY